MSKQFSEVIAAPRWQYNDGGRSAAGFSGKTGDCVCRAIAIATGKPYVSDLLVGRAKPTQDIAVAVPVVRDGTLKYVLFAGVDPATQAAHFSVATGTTPDARDFLRITYNP